MMSFQKAPGQSNYAAGCTFKDAFAKRISQKAPYAVKVVNWGFWEVSALSLQNNTGNGWSGTESLLLRRPKR